MYVCHCITDPVNHKYILLQFMCSLPIKSCLKIVVRELCEYYILSIIFHVRLNAEMKMFLDKILMGA
jgi:hypothetical protein